MDVAGAPVARRGWRRMAGEWVAVVLGSLLLGALTFVAQGLLPEPLAPLANSASGWTLLTALIIWVLRERTLPSALFGAASFVCLVLGYTAAATLAGLTYSPVFFGVAGVIAGPFVGVAAAWLHERRWRAAVGAALLAGIALGECVYGLLVVSATTGWFYWALIGAAGVALLIVTLIRRAGGLGNVVLGAGLTVIIAVAFFGAYHLA